MLTAAFFLALNFFISWYNAKAVGKIWVDSKEMGGWSRVLAWSGAVMSACGFTWVYLTILAMGAGAAGFLPPRYVMGAMELGYVVIILPILGSGFVIWIDSLRTAWRERTFGAVGTAAWNTYAQVHNTMQAVELLPEIFADLGDLFKSDSKSNSSSSSDGDSDDRAALLLILLVVAALAGGVLTTHAILMGSVREHAKEIGDA